MKRLLYTLALCLVLSTANETALTSQLDLLNDWSEYNAIDQAAIEEERQEYIDSILHEYEDITDTDAEEIEQRADDYMLDRAEGRQS